MVEKKEEIGAPAASRHRATDASHQAPSGLGPDGSVSTGAGDWLVIRDYGLAVREIAKATPRLFKLGAGTSRYPRQIGRGDRKIVCSAPDRETAERLRDSIAGIDGEFSRRRHAANEDYNARVKAAQEARDKAIARLVTPSQRQGS